MRSRVVLLGASVALATGGVARASTYEVEPGDDLFGILQGLVAGDEVTIHAGTYVTPGFFEVTWAGSAAQPIVVRGAVGEIPVIQGDPSQNVINVSGSYFTLQNLEITGGSHGIRLASADHATLADLTIHGVGDVGISCNREGETCDALTIRHNEIFDTGQTDNGEGMYLGCNEGLCTFKNCVVELNYLHDLGGSQGDGIEIKTGSFGNVVRDNVIVRSNYPAITMYGFAGDGEPNIVERNFIRGTNDNGIQVVGQIVVRNNVVLDAAGNGIHSKASQSFFPHDVSIVNNTVYGAGSACIKTNDWPGQAGQVIANNAVYCEASAAIDVNGGAPRAVIANNFGLGTSTAPSGFTAGTSVAADLSDVAMGDVYPPEGSALIDGGDPAYAPAEDFNGLPRSDGNPDVGAYERSAAENPGWKPGEGFKDEVPSTGAGATSASGAGGGTAGATGGGASSGAGASSGSSLTGEGDDSGCGCSIVGRTSASVGLSAWWLVFAVAGGASRRRPTRRSLRARRAARAW